MNQKVRWVLIVVITFVVLIAIFYLLLPMTAIPGMIGSAYFFVALVASLVISVLVSWGLGKIIK
jgi:uncharacterized membrane protein YkvA (DUF1232 family)